MRKIMLRIWNKVLMHHFEFTMNRNYYRPSELYEWTLNNLCKLPDVAQETILENLKHLKWIPNMLDTLTPQQRLIFKLTMVSQIEKDTTPFCLMSITCMVYNLKLRGVDTSDFETLINTSEKIRNKIETECFP